MACGSQAAGLVHVHMAVHALFGWLGIGLAKEGGGHNGMNGGRIVMALPGNHLAYTARDGIDLTSGAPTVDEYIINEVGGSSFRLWSTPHPTTSLVAASHEASDCYTSMAFSTATIAGEALNLGGTDSLIWGFNGADSFVGYHGREHRGLLEIDWAAGRAQPPASADTSSGVEVGVVVGIGVGCALLGLLIGGAATCLLHRAGRRPAAYEVPVAKKGAAECTTSATAEPYPVMKPGAVSSAAEGGEKPTAQAGEKL